MNRQGITNTGSDTINMGGTGGSIIWNPERRGVRASIRAWLINLLLLGANVSMWGWSYSVGWIWKAAG